MLFPFLNVTFFLKKLTTLELIPLLIINLGHGNMEFIHYTDCLKSKVAKTKVAKTKVF
jgi:hypothetical protein